MHPTAYTPFVAPGPMVPFAAAPVAPVHRRRVLVTGATGNVGKATVTELLKNPRVDVIAGVRDEAKGRQAFPDAKNLSFRIIDADKPETLRTGFRGVDAVFVIAPTALARCEMVFDMAVAARNAGVHTIAVLSVLGVAFPYSRDNFFGNSFAALETALTRAGVNACFLRASMFLENFFGHMGSIKSQNTVYTNQPANARVACIAVQDIGRAAAAVLSAPGPVHAGRVYNLTGVDAVTIENVASELGRATGRTIKVVQVDDAAATKAMSDMGMPSFVLEGLAGLMHQSGRRMFEEVSPDVYTLTGKHTSLRQWVDEVGPAFK